jgi:hypothetical protein
VSEENGVKSQRGGSYGRMGVIMEEWDMEVEVEEWGQISRACCPILLSFFWGGKKGDQISTFNIAT